MKNLILSVLTSVGLLGGVHESYAQAPPLRAAKSYGLFTSDGSIYNTGTTTTINGKIGTNTGTVNGFASGMYTGTIETVNDSTDVAAKGVAGTYIYLDELLLGTTHGTALGGETLTPGLYDLGPSSTLTGQLILDGQNDPNAFFIIRVAGAFSTAAFSNVQLTNSASWQNVYWHVNGTVNIGADAGFKGTIVANGAITLMANAVLLGRALTQTGEITLNGNRVDPLPVELTSFTADRRSGNAFLCWATASEKNNAYFAVQSSTDGYKYTTIGKVGGHGNTSLAHAYTWTDMRLDRYPTGVIYYRLAQVDADSAKHYSPVRTITTAPVRGLQVQAYPSPSQLPCSLRIDATQAGPATLRLTNALGYLVAERQLLLAMGSNSLPLEEADTLTPGIYLVQVEQGAARQTFRLVRE